MPHRHTMHGVKRQLVFKALNADNKRRIDTLEDQVKKLQEASDRVSQEQQPVRRRLDRAEKSTQLVLENSAEVEELYKTATLGSLGICLLNQAGRCCGNWVPGPVFFAL